MRNGNFVYLDYLAGTWSILVQSSRHQGRIPVAFVFYMLNMTRGAVGLVFGNEYSIGSQLDAAVVTVAAGGAGSFAVDRIRTLVAARTGQLAFRISR